MKPLPCKRRGLARFTRASSYHCLKGREAVCLGGWFVGANPADSREAHRQAGFVARAGVDRIEGDFEYQAFLDLAHRAETFDGMATDPPVEPFQFLVGEPEIGFADRQQIAAIGPAAEGVIAVVARAFARAALGVHQHAIDEQRVAFPFVPQAGTATGDVRTVAALEHDTLDGHIASVGPEIFERFEVIRVDQLRDIEALRVELRYEGLQAGPPLLPA